jgi:hypothetical protein
VKISFRGSTRTHHFNKYAVSMRIYCTVSLPHKSIPVFPQDQVRGRAISKASLFGTTTFDTSTTSLPPNSYLFRVSLYLEMGTSGATETGADSEGKMRGEWGAGGWDSIIFSSLEWKSLYFPFPKKRSSALPDFSFLIYCSRKATSVLSSEL